MASPQPEFVPLPGHRGARRRKVGLTGRLHLDRSLPFLVLHRRGPDDDPSASVARRVALNSPAYLVWDAGPDDSNALELLLELTEGLGRDGMPLLIIALDDLVQPPEHEASSELTPFVATVAGGRSARERRARDVLIKTLKSIEIDLRHPHVIAQSLQRDHWLVRALAGVTDQSDPMLISLPQIHRREDGGIYPQMAHELAVACGDALLQTACAYLDDNTGRAPKHYRSLGRSAFLKAALSADEKLARIASSFDFLLSVSPINTTAALEKFIAGGEQVAPTFRYRPLTVDPDAVKRRLYRLDFSRLEDPLLARLFSDKRHEIDAQLTMLATRNTPSFRPASMFLYGAVSAGLLEDARRILAMNRPRTVKGRTVTAPDIAIAARELIGSYSRNGAFFDAKVDVRDDVTGLMVSRNRLLVGSATAMQASRLDALLAHEVSTHLLTYINGAAQGLSIFRSGLAKYEGIQEGLGVFAEWAVGGLSIPRLRLIAARVVAVDAMQRGSDFMETYRLLRRDLGFSIAGAFGVATRVHRSGGLAKDAIYLEGFRAIVRHIASGGPLAPFWLGKIALSDVPAIEELLQRGLVHAPTFVPSYMSRADTESRIARLSSDIGLDGLLEMEPV
jgi:uncharacterized protein (TIGR02421 family)